MSMPQVDESERVSHTGQVPAPDRRRLARRVRERRAELGLTQQELAGAGGPSTATLRFLENAAPIAYKGKSLRQLEQSLGWAAGSVKALLDGGEPTLLPGGPPPAQALGRELPEGAELLDMIGEQMRVAGYTPSEIVRFARDLGLPYRAELSIVQWSQVAGSLRITLGQALVTFGVVPPSELEMGAPPPSPPVRAVPPARKRALCAGAGAGPRPRCRRSSWPNWPG